MLKTEDELFLLLIKHLLIFCRSSLVVVRQKAGINKTRYHIRKAKHAFHSTTFLSLPPHCSGVLRKWPLPHVSLDVRNLHGPDRERMPDLRLAIAATEPTLRQRVQRGILHGSGCLCQVFAYVHPVRIAHELYQLPEGPTTAER